MRHRLPLAPFLGEAFGRELGPLLAVAVDRIEAITGHTPSTSTTEADGSCPDPFSGCN